MPKILRIINRFNLGGPTYNAAYLTKYLSPDFETLLIGGMKDASEEGSEYILDSIGVEATIIPEMKRSIHPGNDYKAYMKLREIIRSFKPDIVHTHASKAGTLGRLAARSENIPHIFHTFHGHVFHSYFGKVSTTFYKNVERTLARNTSKIIAISERQKEELCDIHKICSPDKVEVIPLGFDLSRFMEDTDEKRWRFRKEWLIDDDEIAVGIIGRLVPVKNHPLFLKAASEVSKMTNKRIRFFIIGDGESCEELLAMSRDMNLDTGYKKDGMRHKITFTSWIKEVDTALAGLDIVALTSFNEGTPVSLIEAQAASKPIVTTKVGGIQNIVQDKKTALLVENNDIEGFVHALLELIESDMLRQKMSIYGRDFVKDTFHYTRLISDMSKLYFSELEKNIMNTASV
jgi:glycosyltransferase involved in cell wall biosynthesis